MCIGIRDEGLLEAALENAFASFCILRRTAAVGAVVQRPLCAAECIAGNLADFEKLLKAPYQNEYYVTRNQIAAYESHEIDDICDYLTVHEVLELPYTARSEYVLYRWNDVFDNAEKIRSMVDRLRFQVECFNEALPYEAGQSYGDRAASQVRVIYRIS